MIKARLTGGNELRAMLRNLADRVPENARKAMHRGADAIVKEAKLNVPVDKHNLEKAIHKEVSYGGRGRLQIDLTVSGYVGGVDVSIYAIEVHENYEGMLKRGPGAGTLAKRAANPGRYIGSKYLERAVEAARAKLGQSIIDAVMRGM